LGTQSCIDSANLSRVNPATQSLTLHNTQWIKEITPEKKRGPFNLRKRTQAWAKHAPLAADNFERRAGTKWITEQM